MKRIANTIQTLAIPTALDEVDGGKTAGTRTTIIEHFPGRPDRRATLEVGVRQILRAMAAEPDLLYCAMHRSQDIPGTLVVYQTWTCSRADYLSKRLARPYRQALVQALPELLVSPRRIEFLDDA